MAYEPTHLKPYEVPSHYFGRTWEGWYPVLTQTRDSGTLTRSNYRTALKRLQTIAGERETPEGESVVTDTRCSHFACGWVETIYVWSGDDAAVEAADEILWYLDEDYGCLDSDDWSRLEDEEAAEYWACMGLEERMRVCVKYDVSIFAARRDEVPQDPRGELVSYLADGC